MVVAISNNNPIFGMSDSPSLSPLSLAGVGAALYLVNTLITSTTPLSNNLGSSGGALNALYTSMEAGLQANNIQVGANSAFYNGWSCLNKGDVAGAQTAFKEIEIPPSSQPLNSYDFSTLMASIISMTGSLNLAQGNFINNMCGYLKTLPDTLTTGSSTYLTLFNTTVNSLETAIESRTLTYMGYYQDSLCNLWDHMLSNS